MRRCRSAAWITGVDDLRADPGDARRQHAAIKVKTASVMLRVLLVLQTNASARRLYSKTPARLRRHPRFSAAVLSGACAELPRCGELPLLGRLIGLDLDWSLMKGPRGL